MVPTYNGWDEIPEDEREELEQWEMKTLPRRRSSQAMQQPDGRVRHSSGTWLSLP
jgi:hypothetical protein